MPLNLDRPSFVDEATGELFQQPARDNLPLEQHPKEQARLNLLSKVASYGAQIDDVAVAENRFWDAHWDRKALKHNG